MCLGIRPRLSVDVTLFEYKWPASCFERFVTDGTATTYLYSEPVHKT